MKGIHCEETEKNYTFSLSGEIDSRNADEFFVEITDKFEKQPKDVIFDCAELNFIDSTTLGTFVKILKHVKSAGKKMKLTSLQPRIKKLFVICSLDTVMEIE